jgi:hypothetical protein
MISQDELYGLAMQALNMAKTECAKGEWKGLALFSRHGGEALLHRMRKIEKDLAQRLGEDWLNSGAAKEAAFGIIRLVTALMPPDALIMVTAMNAFAPAEKYFALTEEERKGLHERLQREGHIADHQAVKEGLLTLHDTLAALAQTPERVCICAQKIEENEFAGQPQVTHFAQAEYRGRTKFFGDKDEIVNEFARKLPGGEAQFIRTMEDLIARRSKPPEKQEPDLAAKRRRDDEVFDFTKKRPI